MKFKSTLQLLISIALLFSATIVARTLKKAKYLDKTKGKYSDERKSILKTQPNTDRDILYLSDMHIDLLYDSGMDALKSNECHKSIDDVSVVKLARDYGFTNTEIKEMTAKFGLPSPDEDLKKLEEQEKVATEGPKGKVADKSDYGRFYCNSPFKLIQSAVDKAYSIKPNPAYVIIGGDMIAHKVNEDYDQAKTQDDKNKSKMMYEMTFRLFKNLIHTKFKNSRILSALGDNDLYEKNEKPEVDVEDQYQRFRGLIRVPEDKLEYYVEKNLDESGKPVKPDIRTKFYYSYTDEAAKIKFIVLNSNLMALKDKVYDNYDKQAVEQQFEFLKEQLDNLKYDQKAFIIMHMPVFKEFMYLRNLKNVRKEYAERLLEIVKKHQDKLILALSSHFHTARFAIDKDKILPTVIFPSLSPRVNTNPGFAFLEIKDQRVNDIDFIFADLDKTLKIKIIEKNFAFNTVYPKSYRLEKNEAIGFSVFSDTENNQESKDIWSIRHPFKTFFSEFKINRYSFANAVKSFDDPKNIKSFYTLMAGLRLTETSKALSWRMVKEMYDPLKEGFATGDLITWKGLTKSFSELSDTVAAAPKKEAEAK